MSETPPKDDQQANAGPLPKAPVPTPCDIESPNPTRLEQSILAADQMIGYAARYAVNIPAEAIHTVTAIKEACGKGAVGAEQEANFYSAFNTISAAIAPVTPASLDACLTEIKVKPKWWQGPDDVAGMTYAKLAVYHYRRLAFAALIVLLVIQVYWVIGATLVSSIPQLNRKEGQSPPANSATTSSASTSTTAVTPSPATAAQPSPATAPADAAAAASAAAAAAAKDEAQSKEVTTLWLLSMWSTPWRWVPELLAKMPSTNAGSFELKNEWWQLGISAQFVLNILQTYVLPLLYGWVGAMAYVMRSLIASVQNRTFRREHEVEYNLRTYLGLLSGLAIGWFVGSGVGKENVASLAPAAISFLAGYSVEILFSMMDRLVAAFGTGAAPKPEPRIQAEKKP
jgi:hypothetical protein